MTLLDNAVPTDEPSGSMQGTKPHFGPRKLWDGSQAFCLWAPAEQAVSLRLEGEAADRPMERMENGWFGLTVPDLGTGALYRFVLPDGTAVADPASRFQPSDVTGPSEIVDAEAFGWTDAAWQGRPWEDCVIYELHIGSFTPEGTFEAAMGKLDHLVELGITAIEIMPVGDFPGNRNWGYDGVLLYAPDSSYGRPDDLRRLVDAAHAKNLMVLLDVVYNHFGPEGNYMGRYAPKLFTDKHKTPWGNAINYGDEGSENVREFIIGNACYWITDFHLDGLRFDAVHAIVDESPVHVLQEMAERVRAAGKGRQIHLVLENDLNQAHLLARNPDNTPKWYNAQWNDDFHHCLHAAATHEDFGYYCAYTECVPLTARSLAQGFAYQGEVSPFTDRPRGEISAYLPPTAFVSFIQNHDQIGNRALGERITDICSNEAGRAITAIYLLAPQIPLLFMGEEWRAEQPFQYFCGFEGELAEAIRKGRREEFSGNPAFDDPTKQESIPDPIDPATFERSKLEWSDLAQDGHRAWFDWYRSLIAVRKREVIPYLGGASGGIAKYRVTAEQCIEVQWSLADNRTLYLSANLHSTPVLMADSLPGMVIWKEGVVEDKEMGPWSVIWRVG